MAGRRPLPTAIKILRDNPGKRPLNTNEPQPPAVPTYPPGWLSPRARRVWHDLAPLLEEMRVLTVADGPALALLCDALAEFIEARAVVRKGGMTYATATYQAGGGEGSVMWRQRPEVGIAQSAWTRAKSMLAEFGMTPAARSKVKAVAKGDGDDNDEARFFGQRDPS